MLTTRYGIRRLLQAGFALLAAGMLLLARLPADGTYIRDVLVPLILIAIGSALSYAPTFVAGTAGVADRDQGLASGFLNSSQELGAAVGLAVLGSVAAAVTAHGDAGTLIAGYRVGLIVAAAAIVAVGFPLMRSPRFAGRRNRDALS
jgi:MFS family permease